MSKLRKYSAGSIFKRVSGACCGFWTEKKIKSYLKKHSKNAVDALWIAKRKDITRADKLWVLIKSGSPAGIAPMYIRHKVQNFINDAREEFFYYTNRWETRLVDNPKKAKCAMRLLVKLLEKEFKRPEKENVASKNPYVFAC